MDGQRADVATPTSPAGDDAAPAAEPGGPPPPETGAETDAGAAPAAEHVAETEQDAPTPADIARQEEEEVLREQRVRWHQRTSLRLVIVLAVLAGLAAVIPYPLRITSECTVIPIEQAKVRSELGGVISEILVDEGQAVTKGDVIARIDDRALKAERLKVLADLDRIEAELAVLRKGHRPEEIRQQQAVLAARRNEVVFAEKEANRREEMAREGIGSRQAAEATARELESRRRAVAEAEAALQLLQAGARPEEIAAHEAVQKRARAELAYVDERLAMTVVRAPIDGEILTPRFRERVHERVEAGGLVCELASSRRMRAEIFIPEREVDVIALGMPAVVKVESYPTRAFEGQVGFIAPMVEGAGGRVRVVVELDNADRALKANMTGYGEVEAGKRALLHLATRRVLRWIRVRFLI